MLRSLGWITAGFAYLFGSSIKETCKDVGIAQKRKLKEEYIALNSDRELEARLGKEILMPSKYNEIWERIERYKRDGGSFYVLRSYDYFKKSEWDDVGKSRLPMFNHRGELLKNCGTINADRILQLLINTYGKMTVGQAGGEAYTYYGL